MPGPPRKPTALKVAEGNPGRKPLPENEPKPKVRKPPAPKFLQGEAKKEYNRLGKKLAELSVMTEVDQIGLAVTSQVWADFVQAVEQAQGKPLVIKTPNGGVMQNPFISVANTKAKLLKGYLAEFGLTPASRSRVVAQEEKTDAMEDFLKLQQAARKERAKRVKELGKK